MFYRRGAAELGNAIKYQKDTFAPCDEQLFSSYYGNKPLNCSKIPPHNLRLLKIDICVCIYIVYKQEFELKIIVETQTNFEVTDRQNLPYVFAVL